MAKFSSAMFGSKINGIGHTDAAYKISAQLDLIWLSYSNFRFGLVWLRFGLAKFGLAMFGSKINGIGHTVAACKISAQLDLIWLSYSFP